MAHQMSSEKQIPVLFCQNCLSKQMNKFADETGTATKEDSDGGDANSQASNRVVR